MASINPDLARERAASTFSREELTFIWDGGKNNTLKRRKIERIVFADQELDGRDDRNRTRDEVYGESIRRHLAMWKKIKQLGITDDFEKTVFSRTVFAGEFSGLTLHDMAFVPMMRMQASDEQLAKWLPLVESFQMIGCYAQTELGHGTFVRGLETTAVYDERTKEFVLNSPTLTSTKWWVGSLGKSANHAIVMAQLYTKGKCHGLHAFLVQLRDKNHRVLPGATIGDIGPKFGLNSVDNGFLQFTNFRIPRENLLMRFSKVLEDGTYIRPMHDKILYVGMLENRSFFPSLMSFALSCAVTIAIRYSLVRRQSELKPNGPEPQILDFQTQQHKLFPLLAQCFAFQFAGMAIKEMFVEVKADVLKGVFSRLVEAHSLSAGLKAVTATRGSGGMEVCRLACGGHGYSLASNLPTLYSDCTAVVTLEGESTVLLLQTARYLIKNCIAALSNKKIDFYMSYLKPESTIRSAKFDGRFDPKSLLQGYEFRAATLCAKVATHLQNLARNMSQEEAWNQSSIQLVTAAEAHVEYVIMRLFVEKVEELICGPEDRQAIMMLCTIHGIYGLIENSGDLLQGGYLTGVDVDNLREQLFWLYQRVRVDAAAYVDAFDIDDRILQSCLGRYDGNVYESLYEWALKSKLNENQVHDSFFKYMKPMQSISKL